MTTPAIVVLNDHPDELSQLLRRRFGSDYHIAPVRTLPRLGHILRQETTALVIADREVGNRPVLDALADLRHTTPATVRCVLSPAADRVTTQQLMTAIDAGCVERCLPTPWGHPDVGLYPQVSDMLAAWWRAVAPDIAAAAHLTVVAPSRHKRLAELRDLADRNNVPTRFLTPDTAEGRRILLEVTAPPSSVVVTAEGRRPLVDPTTAQIGGLVGARLRPERPHCDLAIVGAGPAGLAAAVYAASEGLSTVVLEPTALGGQAGTSSSIRNYPGFPHGISGGDLATLLAQQAWLLGAQTVYRAATALHPGDREHRIDLEGGSRLAAKAVILATGVRYRRLDVPGVDRLLGAGVYHGAARAEVPRCAGQHVFVVGGGNSAGQAATSLAGQAHTVTLLVRGTGLASMSDYLVRQIRRTPNIEVRLSSRVTAAHGSTSLEALTIETDGVPLTEPAFALFVMIGAEPDTAWLPPSIARDPRGFLLTGDGSPRPRAAAPLAYETSVDGIFAIGDVRHGSVKRVAGAVGEGAMSVPSVHARLATRRAAATNAMPG